MLEVVEGRLEVHGDAGVTVVVSRKVLAGHGQVHLILVDEALEAAGQLSISEGVSKGGTNTPDGTEGGLGLDGGLDG